MGEPAKKQATYEDLFSIPEQMMGEIIDGELYATPRHSRRHVNTASSLGYRIGPPYQFGEGGGPGGWIILIESEIRLGEDVLVPDLAGWKRERFPVEEPYNWISAVPDWVCEVLSPGTVGKDKVRKMPIYAKHGVDHLWLVDPMQKSLDVYKLQSGNWFVAGFYAEDDKVRAAPFQDVEIALSDLWLD